MAKTPNISAIIEPKLKAKVQKKLAKDKLSLTWLITKSFNDYLNGKANRRTNANSSGYAIRRMGATQI